MLTLITLALAVASGLSGPAAFAAPPAATITIDVTPEVTEGESIEVVVSAADVADLYAYDLTFSYDPALLALDSDSLVDPAGGFSAISASEGAITLTHTRLGTSPGLAGAIVLGSFSLVALGGGEASIALVEATLISSTSEELVLTDVDEAAVVLTALSEPPATEEPGEGDPTPADPAPTGTPDETAAPVADEDDPPLAATGASTALWLVGGALGLAFLSAGVLLVVRRRGALE